MTYRVVRVESASRKGAATSGRGRHVCVDGSRLRPGSYATVVIELPPSQALNGSTLARGYYAVFWPMDAESPVYEVSPQYFGPFASRRLADTLIFEVSSGPSVPLQPPVVEHRAHHGQVRVLPISDRTSLAAGSEPQHAGAAQAGRSAS